MSSEQAWIRDTLSSPRFAPYLARTGGDVVGALELYWWNVDVSAAFYTSLHCLEMALRNAVHRRLTVAYGRAGWWEVAPLSANGRRKVHDALGKLSTRTRRSTADDVVAELTLGFWVSMVSGAYDRSLWVPHLHRAFPLFRGRRRQLHEDLHTVLLSATGSCTTSRSTTVIWKPTTPRSSVCWGTSLPAWSSNWRRTTGSALC
ncbi:MAG TPA: hypothetical protein VGL64_09480 [Amycolatopsis sp.]|jgi:hypothetical protein